TNRPMTETAEQLLQQGLFHHRQGDVKTVMDRYTQVLRVNPQNPDALYYIAVVACQEGQLKEGIDLARRSLSFNRRQACAHNLIGQALHRMGDIKAALAAFDDALECDVNFAEGYGNRAEMLSELGRASEALSSFDKALALNPKAVPDWINRGALLQALGRAEEALASFDKADALAPNNAAILNNRGMALAALGRNDEALAALDRAIAADAKMAEAHRARGRVLERLGRADEARESIARADDLAAAQKAAADGQKPA